MAENEHMKCTECGATMEIDAERVALVCPYCGNREALDEVTASRLNSQDERDVAMRAIREAREQRKHELQQQERKDRNRRRRKIIIGVLVALFVVVPLAYSAIEDALWEHEQQQKLTSPYEWPTSGLATMIDQPSEKSGHINYNSGNRFEIEVPSANMDFNTYVQSCKDRGFTIDAFADDNEFHAYNADGYRVELYVYTYQGSMEITVDAPKQMSVIIWPTTGLGAQLPAPPSDQGNIESDTATSFRAYVGNITAEQFMAYTNACMEAGFNQDYHRRTSYFSADNSDGATLTVEYEGFNTITIRAYAPRQ